MNLFWVVLLPGSILGLLTISLFVAARSHFFSKTARGLTEIDIPNEVSEIRINELEMLVCDEADFMFKHAWKLTPWQRRRAVSKRLRETRKWLNLVISNAVIFQQIARSLIQAQIVAEPGAEFGKDDLPCRVMDRAVTVHFVAATCMAKLMLVQFCRTLWPFYVPMLTNQFQVRGHDLIAWYRHMANEMLTLAREYYDDVTYTRFIFQLTGLFTMEEAATLNRI
jgi:hypothetical protein